MDIAVERVMRTYGMMVNLTAEQEEDARERLEKFLRDRSGSDQELAVQGLQFLRGSRPARRREHQPIREPKAMENAVVSLIELS